MAAVSTIDLTSPNADSAPVLTFGEGELPSASGKMAENTPEFAPGKSVETFRVYHRDVKEGTWDSTVQRHYHLMRENQTVAFVDRMLAKYSLDSFGKRAVTPEGRAFVEKSGVPCTATDGVNVTVHEMFELLKSYIDSSDPDCETPNKQHMMQTSERARAAGEPDHFVLACLIHDMGKAMYLFGSGADGQEGTASGDQWALGGDTWVVGAKIPDCTVYPEFNRLNADMADPRYNTENGVYEPGCGIMNLK
jgi:inositol oxygenase